MKDLLCLTLISVFLTLGILPTTSESLDGKFYVEKCAAMFASITIANDSSSVNVPVDSNVTGNCGADKSSIIITWEQDSIRFDFTVSNGTVILDEVFVHLTGLGTSGANGGNLLRLSSEETFYSCPKTIVKAGDYTVTLKNLKVQVFNYNSSFSGNGEICDAATTVGPTNATTGAPTTVGPTNATTGAPTTVGPTNATTVAPTTVGPTNATTVAPSTSTVAPKTSTVAPTPPTLSVDKYTVNGTNTTCLVVIAAIQFKIPYEGKEKNLTYDGAIGKNPIYHGTCNGTYADTLSITSGPITLDITFKTQDDQKQYTLADLTLTTNSKDFPNGKDKDIKSSYSNPKTFQLSVGDYYSCKSKTTLQLSSNVQIFITDLKMEAFKKSNSTDIDGKMVLCAGDQQTNSVVPIAVGAALAGLVVVVLIAYLIGRKRSRRGYESV